MKVKLWVPMNGWDIIIYNLDWGSEAIKPTLAQQ